jgi:GGDEF domain-containing protein
MARASSIEGRSGTARIVIASRTPRNFGQFFSRNVGFWCEDARSMDGAGQQGRRPRPLADAPAPDAAGLAKAWLLALVADVPLAQAAAVPVAELARGGPALCAGVLAALRSDAELDRLVGGAEGRPAIGAAAARLTGARTPAALATAVEGLRMVTWRALRGSLTDADPLLVADLGDRLAHVCARVVAASLAAPAPEPPGRAGPLADALAAAPPAAPKPAPEPPAASDGAASAPDPAPPPDGVHPFDLPTNREVTLDPLISLAEELAAGPPPAVDFRTAADAPTITRVPAVDASWEQVAQAGPPWLGAIARRLERRHDDGLPFAVLVVEIDDLDRLLAAGAGREVGLALEAAERGLTAELAPADLVVRERLGRWWLTSPDRDAESARDLGVRVFDAIARATRPGAPLRASIGLAVCPDDGDDLDTLAGRADEGMFAARAAGVPIA